MVWQLLTWPAQSLIWLASKIQERADVQLDYKENLQKELTALQIQLDLGDIDEETYTQREEEILLALDAIAQEEEAEARATLLEDEGDGSEDTNEEEDALD